MSLNIEGSKHKERWIPFVQEHRPDFLCLQEVFEHDLPELKERLDMEIQFSPGADAVEEILGGGVIGLAILSRHPFHHAREEYYWGTPESIPTLYGKGEPEKNKVLLIGEFMTDEGLIRIITTHFTWVNLDDNSTMGQQAIDGPELLRVLESLDHFIFTGDLNSPRIGAEQLHFNVYKELASRYTDHIPSHYTTTIDPTLHGAGDRFLNVIDAYMSTPHYRVADVHLCSGLSDHMAILGTIEKGEESNSTTG